MPNYISVTPHYGYGALRFTEYQTTYAVYRFASITSAWTPVDVATSESEAIRKCKFFEAKRRNNIK